MFGELSECEKGEYCVAGVFDSDVSLQKAQTVSQIAEMKQKCQNELEEVSLLCELFV